MDPDLVRSVNRFAARSGWLHSPARFYAKVGVVVFALLLFITWLLARLDHNVDGQAKAIWAGAAAATAAGAAAIGLYLANRKIGIATIALAVLMATTRVYVGAHYPGDVLAGLILGGTVAAAGARPGTATAAWLVRLVCTHLHQASVAEGSDRDPGYTPTYTPSGHSSSTHRCISDWSSVNVLRCAMSPPLQPASGPGLPGWRTHSATVL